MPGKIDRITHDSQVMQGQACIRGLRITVSLLVNLIAQGKSMEQIVEEYPALEAEDIQQALAYASALARDEVVNL
jgi:uncharacterized protein (DUF433 family)